MPKISMQTKIKNLETQRTNLIEARRQFRSPLKKLRNLPTPTSIEYSEWGKSLNITWYATFANLRDSARYLERFGNACGFDQFSSEDDDIGGDRIYTARSLPNECGISLVLRLLASPDKDDPNATCRRVVIGQETYTHTSTRPKYQLICN